MADTGDLVLHLEANPDDHEQRWSLAKKLYMSWEYRQALEHLVILRGEWSQRVNVVRYLAATYYRLGRYDDAANQLLEGLEIWPDEIGLREQLAKVLEASDERVKAAEVWEEIAELSPDHPLAARAAKRLRKKTNPRASGDLKLFDSDSGIDLSSTQICPHCQAKNRAEFDRCWQCHATLGASAESVAAEQKTMLDPANVWIWTLVSGLVLVALIVVSVFVTLDQVNIRNAERAEGIAPQSVYAVLVEEATGARIITGLVLLLAWPAGLWASISIARASQVPASVVNMSGLILAAGTYALMWLPVSNLMWTATVPAAVSLALVLGLYRVGYVRGLAVWALQGVIAAGVVMACFFLTIGSSAVLGLPAIMAYAKGFDSDLEPGDHSLPSSQGSATYSLQWKSSGSAWLDERASAVTIVVTSGSDSAQGTIQLEAAGEVITTRSVNGKKPTQVQEAVRPDTPYSLRIKEVPSSGQTPFKPRVHGVLRHTFKVS
jgi:tetratricopeptide (TPR) repeat protein